MSGTPTSRKPEAAPEIGPGRRIAAAVESWPDERAAAAAERRAG
jgi:hypothetical protein